MTHGDKVLLPLNHPLVAQVVAGLEAAGQKAEVTELVIGGERLTTTLTQIVVVGKRQGEGKIAKAMKEGTL